MPKKKNQPRLPSVSGNDARAASDRRAAASQVMRAQQRRASRRRLVMQVSIAVVVVVAVIGTTIAVLSSRDADGPSAEPAGLTSDGAVRFGSDDAPVTVQVIEDFQCPACQQFEQANGDLLAGYVDGKDVAVEYRPISFLDRASSTEYSTRALNASMCVLDDSGPDAWLAMHEALYAQQPEEGGAGLDDDQLIDMAADAGAEGDSVASCIDDRAFGTWAADATAATEFDSTPTVSVDGTVVEPADLATAVDSALQAAGS